MKVHHSLILSAAMALMLLTATAQAVITHYNVDLQTKPGGPSGRYLACPRSGAAAAPKLRNVFRSDAPCKRRDADKPSEPNFPAPGRSRYGKR